MKRRAFLAAIAGAAVAPLVRDGPPFHFELSRYRPYDRVNVAGLLIQPAMVAIAENIESDLLAYSMLLFEQQLEGTGL